MKSNKKTCDGCGEQRYIWKNVSEDGERKRYCKTCYGYRNKSHSKPKQNKPLAPRSPKRAKQERTYNQLAKSFKEENPVCQAGIVGVCTHYTSDVHHVAGRVGDKLLDQSDWLAVCRQCHTWIESHLKEARELGFSKTKL